MEQVVNRRGLLSGLALGAASMTISAPPVRAAGPHDRPALPKPVLVYDAVALLEETIPHGRTPMGERFRVPIIGGSFEGPDIRGRILSGGWDWQLKRADGFLELVADYFMETDDKVLIQVANRGLVNLPSPDGPATYAMSTPCFEAPMGKYGWLNQHVFVGTVAPGEGPQPSVRLSIYKLV